MACRKPNGEITNNKGEILERWKEYFKELLDGREEEEQTQEETEGQSIPSVEHSENLENEVKEQREPSIEDVKQAIKRINNNRALGPDNINGDFIKIDELELIKKIHEFMSKAWKQEKLPEEWEEGLTCPVYYKKGDPLDCQNYRGITLLNTAHKVVSNILYERLKPHVEKVIENYQCEFQAGKSTVDKIHTLRQILDKMKEYNVGMYHLFVDFKAAYDSIYRDKLFKAMEEFAIPTKLISITKITLSRVICKVKIQNNQSAPFVTEKGLRQGDALVCMLFNITLEKKQ
jgi:sorting nexin-29